MLFIMGAAILSMSMAAQAGTIMTATGRTSSDGCRSWETTTLAEKQVLQNQAATFAHMEMEEACRAQGNETPVVLDVTVRGYKCATLAQAGLYLMNVSYTCEK